MIGAMTVRTTNWAGNITFGARQVHRPASEAELADLVAALPRVRALGTRHSFNRLADTDGDLVDLTGLPPVIELDPAAATVTVGAGVRYGELATRVHAAGFGLPNLASLPHISVAGACATATHGSGVRNGNLATAVRAVELVTGTGEVVRLARGQDGFAGAVVGLGALGIVTRLTLDLLPSFEIRQFVYEGLPRKWLADQFDEVMASGYSVSLFTSWAGSAIEQVWVKQQPDEQPPPDPSWLDARRADGPRHPVPGMPVANCTQQLGVPGPWHERLPHFRLEFTPSSGQELQSEYFVPRAQAVAALSALDPLAGRIAPLLQISEVRTIAADDLWLSPCYQRDSVAFHFTWVPDVPAVTALLPAIEEALAPYHPRPHWGKLFTLAPEVLAGRYERLADFRRLRERFDPAGRFRNAFTDRYLA